jgi:hypothetical protein
MTRIPLANQIFVKLAVLIFVAAFTVVPSRAQTQDFEIMVSGPWQFVVAKDDSGFERLFVVAPQDKTHVAYLWSGTDASMKRWKNTAGEPYGFVRLIQNNVDLTSGYQRNVYRLDFSGYTRQAIPSPHQKRELAYETATQVDSNLIGTILFPKNTDTTISRFAVSLPKPDFVRTYSGRYGAGTAEAEIDTALGGTSAPASYATWTVLHYGIAPGAGNPPNSVSASGGQNAKAIPFGDKDNYGHYGISISLIEAPLCKTVDKLLYFGTNCVKFSDLKMPLVWTDDQTCDSLSGLSFSLSAKLWSLSEYVIFPQEKNANGDQDFGNYDYECGPYGRGNVAMVSDQQEKVAKHNLEVALNEDKLLKEIDLAEKILEKKTSQKVAPEFERELSSTLETVHHDLEAVFDEGVPTNLANDLYCACTDALPFPKDSVCQVAGAEPLHCEVGTDRKGEAIELLEKLEKLSGLDKGSSDCHAAQISINGAIKPQP